MKINRFASDSPTRGQGGGYCGGAALDTSRTSHRQRRGCRCRPRKCLGHCASEGSDHAQGRDGEQEQEPPAPGREFPSSSFTLLHPVHSPRAPDSEAVLPRSEQARNDLDAGALPSSAATWRRKHPRSPYRRRRRGCLACRTGQRTRQEEIVEKPVPVSPEAAAPPIAH